MMRAFVAAALTLACACAWGDASAAAAAADCVEARDSLVYLGTDGTPLRAARLHHADCTLAALGPVAGLAKPRWAVAHPALPLLYVAGDGVVSAFRIDRKTGTLAPVNEAPAGGAGTTFLALDAASQTLLTANFGAGSVATLTVNPDGSLGPLVSTLTATGSGPHRRQASPHAHGISLDPTGRHALVADMGADRVFVYAFDRATRTLKSGPQAFATPPGSGPRRAVFDVAGRHVYVLNELSAEIMVLRWEAPRLALVQTLPLSSPDFTGARSASELMSSRDGSFVYVANRGQNELQVYRVDAADGSGPLTLIQRLPSGGEAPWAFDISPSGRTLLVANYRSNRLNLFTIDPASGRLTDSGRALDSPAPVSVSFVSPQE